MKKKGFHSKLFDAKMLNNNVLNSIRGGENNYTTSDTDTNIGNSGHDVSFETTDRNSNSSRLDVELTGEGSTADKPLC